jgi:hypothetical protein
VPDGRFLISEARLRRWLGFYHLNFRQYEGCVQRSSLLLRFLVRILLYLPPS